MLTHTTRPPAHSELRNGALVVTDNRTPADRPNFTYNNGRLFQDGRPATLDETAAFNLTNPYVTQNWLATPEDRGGRTPGALPSLPEPQTPTPEITRPVDPRFATQSPAMATYLTELLNVIQPLFLTQPETATPTSAASLSAPMSTTATAPLRQLLPGLSSKFGRARQA